MFTRRYHIGIFLGLLALVGVYLLLPLGVSYLLTRGLYQHGYENVIVQLSYPGPWSMRIPVVSFQQNLGGEKLLISLTNIEIQYRWAQLIRGHVGSIVLPDVAIQVLTTPRPSATEGGGALQDESGSEQSPWALLTAGDLLHRLPILPFEELHLDRVTIFREEATGPLRKMTISGAMMYRDGELGGHLSFQGRDTASYGLTVTGNSASTWSATLVSQRLQAVPIVSWQSQARPNGQQIEVNGQLEVNVRELAPFIALLVPIGPELGKVTGHVTVSWAGTAAAEAALTSLWHDARTRLEGHVQAHVTLPALKGIAKDVAVSYQGTFAGNAMQLGWTLAPGAPLVATINAQPQIIPDTLRTILPRGDQPLRIDHSQPVHGTLYWAETPARMVLDGPLHVAYGKTSGPLMAEFEATRVEGVGYELLSAEGTYHVAGSLPKTVIDLVSAQEASADLRGTMTLTRTHAQGVLLPSSTLVVRHIERGPATIPGVILQLSDALPLQCDVAAVRCSAGPATVSARIPTMRVWGKEVRMAQGAITVQLAETARDSWHTQGKLSVRGVSLNPAPWGMPPADVKVRFLANQTGIKADLRIGVPSQDTLVAAEIDQPLTEGQGVLHATVGPIEFNGEEHRLSKLIPDLPIAVEVSQGQLSSTVDATWSSGMGDQGRPFRLISGTAKVTVDKLSAQYQEYRAKEISTAIELRAQDLESVAIAQPAPVTIASVQTGVEVTNLSVIINGTWPFSSGLPVIEAKDFRCEVFGGTVTSAGMTADMAQPPFTMTFSLQDWDLAKILSLEQNQDIQGTGILNGTLPVAMTLGGVTVKDGIIAAQPPGGIIRYGSAQDSSKVISEASTQLNLVTQALNNFHYTALRVGVNYAENGTVFLAARLEGRNPDLAKIPPINFNLTVEEHIPTLLKSLRLVENIEKAVEKKYKRP